MDDLDLRNCETMLTLCYVPRADFCGVAAHIILLGGINVIRVWQCHRGCAWSARVSGRMVCKIKGHVEISRTSDCRGSSNGGRWNNRGCRDSRDRTAIATRSGGQKKPPPAMHSQAKCAWSAPIHQNYQLETTPTFKAYHTDKPNVMQIRHTLNKWHRRTLRRPTVQFPRSKRNTASKSTPPNCRQDKHASLSLQEETRMHIVAVTASLDIQV